MKDYVNWAILAPGIIANSMATAMNGVVNSELTASKQIKLYAVASRNLERAQAFAKKYHMHHTINAYLDFVECDANDKDAFPFGK